MQLFSAVSDLRVLLKLTRFFTILRFSDPCLTKNRLMHHSFEDNCSYVWHDIYVLSVSNVFFHIQSFISFSFSFWSTEELQQSETYFRKSTLLCKVALDLVYNSTKFTDIHKFDIHMYNMYSADEIFHSKRWSFLFIIAFIYMFVFPFFCFS